MTLRNTSQRFVNAACRFVAPILIGSLIAGPLMAFPKGEKPFGVYDPEGYFSDSDEVTIEHLFLPWEDVYLPTLVDADVYALERGRSVLVTIEPWTWNRSERNEPRRLSLGLQSGEYDKYMRAICSVLNVFESPVTVRWAQEMEDRSGQFIWANWNPETYKNAFRRMVDICRAEAPKLTYMWSPLGYEYLTDYYPGDDYVDIVGLSVFGHQNWERDILGEEQSFKDILGPRYERVVGFGKPIVVAELGYTGDADYVAKWDGEVRMNYPEFPNVVAVVYFHQKEVYPWPNGYGYPNWKFPHRVTD